MFPIHLSSTKFSQIERLEDVSGTLEELWISYNQISTLDGLNMLSNLTTLYISNNLIKSWSELDKLVSLHSFSPLQLTHIIFSSQAGLPNLRDVLFVGNPIYDDFPTREACRIEVIKRLPQIIKLDGDMVKPSEKEAAQGISAV